MRRQLDHWRGWERQWLWGLLSVCCLLAAGVAARAGEEDGWVSLFNGQDLSGWKRYLDPGKGGDPNVVWTVKDGVIHCVGKPAGYILTEGEYENYVLKFEWRWPAKPGNSGCFVHVVGEDMIWPKGVEAQLMSGHAGDFWLVGDFKLKIDDSRKDKSSDRHWFRTKNGVEKPVGEWNEYEIHCTADAVRLMVNGQEVNVGTEPELTKGRILLQSEGAPIEFRNIRLKPLQ